MLNFNQFTILNESKFNTNDYPKYGGKYPSRVIQALLDGKPVKLHDSDETITIDDFDKHSLEKILDDVEHTTYEDFNNAFNGKIRAIWSKIEKTPFRDNKKTGGDSTAASEAAVIVALDLYAHNKTIDDLSDYQKSNSVHVSDKDVAKAVNLLTSDKKWRKSINGIVHNIVKSITHDISKYEFHYGDDLYHAIIRTGATLAGFDVTTRDRWNPADIFLVKKGVTSIPSYAKTNIVAFNEWVGKCDDVIGISIKKGDVAAQHGSIGVGRAVDAINKLDDLPNLDASVDNFKTVKASLPTIRKQLQTIKQSAVSKYFYVTGTDSQLYKALVGETDDHGQLKNNTFQSAIPMALQFFVSASKTPKQFEDVIKMCYLYAASRTPTSCNFWKVGQEHAVFVDQKTAVDFKVLKVIVPLNGNSTILIECNVNGNRWFITCRSRRENTKPLFSIEHRNHHTEHAIPISQVKL